VLSSIEYPIAAIAWLEHADAVAFKMKGEETWEPFEGDVTVTLEKAGTAKVMSTRTKNPNRYLI
jgi:hypothetical protein